MTAMNKENRRESFNIFPQIEAPTGLLSPGVGLSWHERTTADRAVIKPLNEVAFLSGECRQAWFKMVASFFIL
jgi:hypothetical protein